MGTYLSHWQLNHRPFEDTFEEGAFFAGEHHREALERLLYLVRDGDLGFGLLTGEVGCGKTMVAKMLQNRLQGLTCRVLYIPNAFSEFDDLLEMILDHLTQRPGIRHTVNLPQAYRSRYSRIRYFQDIVYQNHIRLRRHLVIVLDEAHQLSESALIELRNLTNQVHGRENYVTLMLCGQPELGVTVQDIPEIDQRIGLRYHLSPLRMIETSAYVECRLRAAGAQSEIFALSSYAAIHQATDGIPRAINRVCTLALDMAFTRGLKSIEAPVIDSITADAVRQRTMV